MKKKVFYVALICGLIGASIGYYMFNKPLDSIESMKTEFAMSSDDLLEAFENDETAANKKYLDKVIEVSGTVGSTEIKNGKTSIYIMTENDLSNVIFQLEKTDPSIKKGQKVTLKGICTGYLMDVVLVRATKV